MKKELVTNIFGVLTIVILILLIGNGGWWSLSRPVEVGSGLFFIAGFSYFYAWPRFRDMKNTQARVCPHCGQLLTAKVYRDTRDVG